MRHVVLVSLIMLFCMDVAYAQTILSFKSNSPVYSPGETAVFRASIVSEENIVDYKAILFITKTSERELVSIPGDTIVYTNESLLSMNSGQKEIFEYKWIIPATAEPGIYRAKIVIKSPSGIAMAFMPELFDVININQKIKSIKLWNLSFQYNNDYGDDLEGFHVPSSSKFSMSFNIQNTGNIPLDLNIYLNFTMTFEPDKSAFLKEKSVSIYPGETKIIVLDLKSPSKPASYTPIINVIGDGIFSQLIGRLVVEGVSGTILHAHADKLFYIKDEYVNTTVRVIGAADYKSNVKNAELSYEISDSKGKILENKRRIDLTSNPVEYVFSDKSPKNFANYTLKVFLKKDGNVLSEFQSNYLGGAIPKEYEKYGDEESKEKRNWWLLILANVIIIMMIILILLFLFYKKKVGEENEEKIGYI